MLASSCYSAVLLVVPAEAFFFAGAIEGCFSRWNGGRCCWDLSFLDAQTGSMNSMKMTMKVEIKFSSNSKENSTLYIVERGGYLYP